MAGYSVDGPLDVLDRRVRENPVTEVEDVGPVAPGDEHLPYPTFQFRSAGAQQQRIQRALDSFFLLDATTLVGRRLHIERHGVGPGPLGIEVDQRAGPTRESDHRQGYAQFTQPLDDSGVRLND